MLAEPKFKEPYNAGRCYLCIEGEHYCAYLDQEAAVTLLYGLYWLARDHVLAEEISLASTPWKEAPPRGKRIGYCEFNTVPSHVSKKHGKTIRKAAPTIRHTPHGVYSPEADRLDYFVSIEEVTAAYEALTLFLENKEGSRPQREVTLFGTLLLRLVST